MKQGDQMIVGWMPGDWKQMEAYAPPSGAAPKRSVAGIPAVITLVSAQAWNGERAVGMTASHWFLFVLTGALPLVWIVQRALGVIRRQVSVRRARLGLCLRCGYDLRGTPQRCPECGADTAPSPRSPHNPPMHRTGPAV
jgi:hypothetical protein